MEYAEFKGDFNFSFLERKNLAQELKIVYLVWTLLPHLIQICRIQR